MIRKTWHKQHHRRKIWKTYPLFYKIWHYMKPFVINLIVVWLQPLPVPTILKVVYSSGLLLFLLLPVIYPMAVFLSTYWVIQYVGERDFGVQFPPPIDLIRYVDRLSNIDPTGKYKFVVSYYFHHVTVMAAAIVSIIDYFRLAISAMSAM